MNITITNDKALQMRAVERQKEGGAAMPDRAVKTTPPSADIMESLATRRQSVAKR